MCLHSVIKSKVDHVEKSISSHGGGDAFTQQTIPSKAILLDDLPGYWPENISSDDW